MKRGMDIEEGKKIGKENVFIKFTNFRECDDIFI